ADLIEKPRQNECQRLDCADLVVQIERFHKSTNFRMRIQRPRPHSACELVQTNALLPKTLRNLQGRKFRECSERANSPAFEGFQNFRRNGKNSQRQTAEPFSFGCAIKHRYSRKALCR